MLSFFYNKTKINEFQHKILINNIQHRTIVRGTCALHIIIDFFKDYNMKPDLECLIEYSEIDINGLSNETIKLSWKYFNYSNIWG
jgi:hypothetical protein